jgi:hypothetical protein
MGLNEDRYGNFIHPRNNGARVKLKKLVVRTEYKLRGRWNSSGPSLYLSSLDEDRLRGVLSAWFAVHDKKDTAEKKPPLGYRACKILETMFYDGIFAGTPYLDEIQQIVGEFQQKNRR